MIVATLTFAALAATINPTGAVAGKALFERNSVASPSATHSGDGLGPLYDARSCSACHIGGGPGQVSESVGSGLLVRLGRSDGSADPVYGAQLQSKAIAGVTPEASIAIVSKVLNGLRMPSLRISDLAYGPLAANTNAGIRRAPSLHGAAQLASVTDQEILAIEAREHRNGMQGHAAILPAARGSHIGRFGWKAAVVDLTAQTALALERDIGLSTSDYPDPWGECTSAESACRELGLRNAGAGVEVADATRDLFVSYVSSLSAPAMLDEKSRGHAVFERAGCGACHTTLKAANGTKVYALTDLLLHDMGAELEDGIAEGNAKSSEWRTAPLWNLADELASGGLLHDGRARSIGEAVQWHGGDASRARSAYQGLSSVDQAAIGKYLLGK
jgi:CxxC motif-containing protein (DUF1111 family)